MWTLGLDVAKYRHHATLLDEAGGTVFSNLSFTQSREGVAVLLERLAATGQAPAAIRLSPGCVETPVWNRVGLPQDQVVAVKESFVPTIPLQRFGEAGEIAAAALFLASDDSSYVTGANIAADGGVAQV